MKSYDDLFREAFEALTDGMTKEQILEIMEVRLAISEVFSDEILTIVSKGATR